jgi:hypothetical protein
LAEPENLPFYHETIAAARRRMAHKIMEFNLQFCGEDTKSDRKRESKL